jgi:acetyl-CoA synthetase
MMTAQQFWAERAAQLVWQTPWTQVCDASFAPDDVRCRWFDGGMLNVAENCLDRHLTTRGEQVAILFVADDPAAPALRLTYRELHNRVCRAANMLLALGVQAGDTVMIYLPMIPEAAIAMLACARIGAVHSVVFGGFSPQALRARIQDSGARVVITADAGRRGGKLIPLKANVDAAVTGTTVTHVLVVPHTGIPLPHQPGDVIWDEAAASPVHSPTAFPSEHPLFILYTSGSTGTPKGLVHSSAGYLVYARETFRTVFEYRDGDVYWCTADVGWITGHSYIVYGPLAAGATTVMYEGIPSWPDSGRFWEIIATHGVTQFYTAPTAIRLLMREGDASVQRHDLSSLRVLGSVGEPINPEAWRWYHTVVGGGRCPIVDTWWQTETGGHLITPLPATTPLKPGAAMRPFTGITPVILDTSAQPVSQGQEGALCIAHSWPGQARTIWGDHERFLATYFAPYPNHYFSGDAARQDEDGDFWILGRMDDVLNVSGHRIGTAEIESALAAHPAVTEAAVVSVPHPVTGEAIYAYVTLHAGHAWDAALTAQLKTWVREAISPIAQPAHIQCVEALPKTRSGKIMRRILRKIAAGEVTAVADVTKLGDLSTLLNPEAVTALLGDTAAPQSV